MAMKRCPVCGEKYSDTYRYCPFCEEADLDQEEDPRRAPGRSGRRVGVGSPRRPNLMTPVLVVLILLMAALLVYLLWGDKLTGKDKDKDQDNKPGVEDPITPDKPGQKDPATQEPVATDPPAAGDPAAQEPSGEMPDEPVTPSVTPDGPDTSYEAASALPSGLTLTNVSGNDFTRKVSEGAYRLKVSGGSGTYTWISEDPGIASVDSEGSVTPISAGVTHVLVTDGSKKVICTVRVVGGGSAPASPSTGTSTATPSTGGGTLKAGAATVINGGNGVRVRSGPGTSYDILATVPNGGSVQVVQSAGDGWYEITFSNVGGVKTTGYMKGEYLSN